MKNLTNFSKISEILGFSEIPENVNILFTFSGIFRNPKIFLILLKFVNFFKESVVDFMEFTLFSQFKPR